MRRKELYMSKSHDGVYTSDNHSRIVKLLMKHWQEIVREAISLDAYDDDTWDLLQEQIAIEKRIESYGCNAKDIYQSSKKSGLSIDEVIDICLEN